LERLLSGDVMPRPASLSVELLRTLVSLVRNGGDAAAAARELKINQPSMSKRLRVFQHPKGLLPTPWVEREGHVWKLTPAGEQAFPAIQEIISRYRQLVGTPTSLPAGPIVAFACGQSAILGHVREALAQFRKQHPSSRVRIRTLRSQQRLKELAACGLDLAEVSQDETTAREIAGKPLMFWSMPSEPLVLAVAARSPWAAALAQFPEVTPLKPKAVSKLGAPLLLPEPGAASRRGFDRAMTKSGYFDSLSIELETGGWGALLTYAKDGHGAAVVSEIAAAAATGLVVRKLDPALFPPSENRLVARRKPGSKDEPDLSPEGEAFRDALLEAAVAK
jgi:DNA-binding transcriptional LysR family regulator